MRISENDLQVVGQFEPFVVDLSSLHSESGRGLVFWLDEWDVRMSVATSDEHRLLVVNGMFHIQLWHPQAKLSVLTPSPLTGHQFEASSLLGKPFRSESYDELAAVVRAALHVDMPHVDRVREVFFAMCTEFLWPIPGAVMPTFRFRPEVAAK